ncbi:MAG: leucyl aminopeptidase [Variibacter sp.]|jgi:leucyl aminopeptidase|nr:leucyl aminopeptidase [Variibacter sp.]
MHQVFATTDSGNTVAIWLVSDANYATVRDRLTLAERSFADSTQFAPAGGRIAVLPNQDGGVASVLFGVGEGRNADPFVAGSLPGLLPPGPYRFANATGDMRLHALAFALGTYRFTRYRKSEQKAVTLVSPKGVDVEELLRVSDAVTLGRDLVNTPANDMGPAELEDAARTLAQKHLADFSAIIGDDLLRDNFPLIHAVGRASTRAPRLLDLTFGQGNWPKVTVVGKGVCFDTGGLDLKPESAMLIMKKDMGGAASALALADMIMGRGLKIRLRVLIPAVENSVSGPAFRPLDIYRSRKGITVEIGNTDAEGRLVLADALALADEEGPDLLIDMGTLTGAARVALGPDLPPFYTEDDALAADIAKHAAAENDPVWRMPLWRPYKAMLDSKIADTNNVGGSFAGSITCALFLAKFVERAKSWAHFDIYAWTPKAKPGRPEGGECQAARALYALLSERYG